MNCNKCGATPFNDDGAIAHRIGCSGENPTETDPKAADAPKWDSAKAARDIIDRAKDYASTTLRAEFLRQELELVWGQAHAQGVLEGTSLERERCERIAESLYNGVANPYEYSANVADAIQGETE